MEGDSQRYTTYMEFIRSWMGGHAIHCIVTFEGTKIAIVVVDLLTDTVNLVEGRFSPLPHNAIGLLMRGETYEERQLQLVKESVHHWVHTSNHILEKMYRDDGYIGMSFTKSPSSKPTLQQPSRSI